MKIALAQINPTIGDFKGNMEKIERFCASARDAGADLTVFSELVLSGYPPRDLLNKPEFVEQGQKTLEALISRLRGPAVLCGHYERTEGNSGLANAATLFQDGKILARTRKV
ncbi:MAG: NAD+ synthase, partial [Nitrospinae bacterium]|nr:NAD+ synthase [Nitrospinota bacterium]